MTSFRPKSSATGFTLVELVVIIVLLGILAVAVAPRFQGSSGLAEYTYQARLISALRTMQTRAMHDSRDGFCFIVNIFTGEDSSFGPPTLDYSAGNQAATCTSTIDASEDSDYVVAEINEMANDNVSIVSGGGTIAFNGLGCPISGNGACADDFRIEIQGETSVFVCIESQGYVHACE